MVVNVSQPLAYEVFRPLVKLPEVVRGVDNLGGGVAQPLNVRNDRFDVLGFLSAWISIIKPQVADAVEVLGNAEIGDDGLGVANVEIAVRLRWEPGLDAAVVSALFDVRANNLMNEVRTGLSRVSSRFCHGRNLTGVCQRIPIDFMPS